MGLKNNLVRFGAVVAVAVSLVGCVELTAEDRARLRGEENARTGATVERRNYEWRYEISQDSSTILWCTFSFPQSNTQLVTVPVVGKLTSGGKRSFGSGEDYGQDEYGMYGSSDGNYRYGFGPGGKGEYYDFSQMPSFCTTVPMTFQAQKTIMLIEPAPGLSAATARVRELIKQNKTGEASAALRQAVKDYSANPR